MSVRGSPPEARHRGIAGQEDLILYVFSTCPRDCYDTCSMVTRVRDGRVHSVEANSKQPFTGSALCPKGRNIGQHVHSKQRLLYPMRRAGRKGSGEFEKVTWNDALKEIAQKASEASERHGPESVLQYGYCGTTGLIQRYFPSRFFNAINASRISGSICSGAGEKALEIVYGSSLGMLPDEIEACRLIVVWGMNPAWSSPHGFEMLRRASKRGAKVYVIDPVRTATAELGVHLRINPATDGALALGIMNHLIQNRLCNELFIEKNTLGFERLAGIAAKFDMRTISRTTGLDVSQIEDFIGDYVSLRPSCIMIGYGMQRQRNGGDMVRAICMLPALIGEERGFFYSTDLDDFDMDYLEGNALRTRKLVEHNMVDLGRTLQTGKVRMMFVYNSNPLATLPNQPLVRKGFSREDLYTVVHDLFQTDTADYADMVLPATSSFEHYDIHTSYFHPYLSVNEKAIEPLGEAKCNSDLFRALASAMRLRQRELFEEDEKIAKHLISRNRSVEGRFEDITKKGYLRRKLPDRNSYGTPSGRIELYSESAEEEGLGGLPVHSEVARTHPYMLLSPVHKFLSRSQYHLRWPDIQPVVQVHPEDAKAEGLDDGSSVTLSNEFGEVTVKCELTDAVPRGVLLMYSAPWPKLCGGVSVNFLTTDFVQRYGDNSAFNSTFVKML